MKKNIIVHCFLFAIFISSCGNKKQEEALSKSKEDKISIVKDTVSKSASIADSTALRVKSFLINNYLVNDLKVMEDNDRKFQYENIDLNDDGIPETFVRFSSSYFCGSGGCTFLLLDSKQNIITKFTVMEAPLFVEKTKKNGWAILLVKDKGVYKELGFNGKKYPSNPSILPRAKYDAPSGHANVLFDKAFSESKINEF